MTLGEIIGDLENLDNDLTIYVAAASKWNVSSEAMVGFDHEGYPPSNAIGMEYFLEVALAKDVLAVWREWQNGKEPTLPEKCEAIIYYAENDAYLSTK